MASPKKSSMLPRYLLARLRVLQRPSVWKAAAVPVLALTFASLYWLRPAWLEDVVSVGGPAQSAYRPQPNQSPKPSPIPAAVPTPSFDPADLDIDTLPNLGTLGLPASRSSNPSPSPLPIGTNPLDASGQLPATPSPSSTLPGRTAPLPSRNPFSPNYAPGLPGSGAIAGPPTVPLGAVPLGAVPLGTGDRPFAVDPNASSVGDISGSTASPTLNPTVHPLESALQRQGTPSPQGNVSTPLLPGAGQAGAGDRLPPTSTPRLAPTLPGQSSTGFYAPRTSPPLGSTGYTLPSASQTAPVQSLPLGGRLAPTGLQPVPLQPGSTNSGGGQNSSGAARPQFGNGSFYTAPPANGAAIAPADLEPPPFSSSDQRGRNGQINTFSNP